MQVMLHKYVVLFPVPVLSKFVFEKLVMCNWFISLPVIKEKNSTHK